MEGSETRVRALLSETFVTLELLSSCKSASSCKGDLRSGASPTLDPRFVSGLSSSLASILPALITYCEFNLFLFYCQVGLVSSYNVPTFQT
mmetsp:Transcript_16770/g.21782  ORF Transcript_16770/g.21782 Transcript_16770/m.21782 type:complete len:91 (-) Transcript_16770:20-292(-)